MGDPQYMEYMRLANDPDPRVRVEVAKRQGDYARLNSGTGPNIVGIACDPNPDVVIALGTRLSNDAPLRHFIVQFHPDPRVRNAVRNSTAPTQKPATDTDAPF